MEIFNPSDISITHFPFWVRIYNLPLDSRTKKEIRRIGGAVCTVMEVESDVVARDRSARVCVSLNITKQLRRTY